MVVKKFDLKRERKDLYAPPTDPVLVDVSPMKYLAIDGRGDPKGPEYLAAVEALFAVSYGVKFALKREAGLNYTVMPLEGLWWADDPLAFTAGDRENWQWTALIAQMEETDHELVRQVAREAGRKGHLPALPGLRLEGINEGRSAQVMHVGPFTGEGPTIRRLHTFIAEQGLSPRGKHHEIYLSDTRRTSPDRQRTVIRQPVS